MTWSRWLIVVLLPAAAAAAEATVSSIGPQGQVIVNGRAIVPLAVWAQPTYLFEYHRQLGATCIISPTWERGRFHGDNLDAFAAAEKHSLALIQRLGRRPVDHPAVWGWIGGLMESPADLPRLRRNRQRHQRLGADRFMMINIKIDDFLAGRHEEAYKEALTYTDAVISHVWPELRDPTTHNLRNVGDFVDRVRRYSRGREGGEVSIWVELNPHQWRLKDSEGGASFRAPTLAELRFQIWLALIRGADGICIFPISFDPFVYSQIPALAEKEIAFNAELIRRMTPALVGPPSELAVAVTSDRPDGVLDVTTRQADGSHYVFVLNGGRTVQTVTIAAPGLGSTWAAVDAITDRPVSLSDGALRRRLSGLELSIFELRPAEAGAADDERDGPAAGQQARGGPQQ